MPADYDKIRDENIARYGWDTAVLDLLGQLYSDRTHFIFELIQNAEDAGATGLAFELFDDRLEVRHDGRPFTEADVRGVCGVGQTGKSADLTAIGQFGIGFKSVYAYTKTPRVWSGQEHFGIEMYVRPFAVPPLDEPAGVDRGGVGPATLFVFPFDHDTVPAATAVREISAALSAIEPGTLLFLRNIARLSVRGRQVTSADIRRTAADRTATSRRVTLSKGGREQQWLVWHREVGDFGDLAHRVELAFRAAAAGGEPRLVPTGRSPLTVFFPTEKETFLGFLVQGPYRTTPARDNIPEHDPANQALVRRTADLLADVLTELRTDGLVTVDLLTALPLEGGRFPPGSMFRPLFEAVREVLAHDEIIPVSGGGYGTAADVKLAPAEVSGEHPAGAGLPGLFGPERLGALYGAGRPLHFADTAITEGGSPVLHRYLREEIGIEEVTQAALAGRLTREFLQAQPDEWITRLYGFLHRHPSLWQEPRFPDDQPGPARTRPVIRLEDGSHVVAFGADGRPAVYLPGRTASGFPTVRRAIADSPAARPFLDSLGLAEPDVVDEVLEIVLPRYDGLDVAGLDPAQHDADLEWVVRALDEAGPARRRQVMDRLAGTAFLIGENAATGEPRMLPPAGLYQRSKDLETYFGGNPAVWFAADTYGPWLAQLRGMGVRQAVQVHARAPGELGHVVTVTEFARQERGLDGFDPAAEIDGLDFALAHPSHARSEYVWNCLLVPYRALVAGVVERAIRPSFADSSQETVSSAIGAAAEREAWLPGPDGTFRRPAELSLDDLPPTFARDETLARSLRMPRPVVTEAARQLGIPVEILWGLKAHPDLAEMVRRELQRRAAPPGDLCPVKLRRHRGSASGSAR